MTSVRSYAGASLVTGSEVRDAFETTKNQLEYEMAAILAVGGVPATQGEGPVQVT